MIPWIFVYLLANIAFMGKERQGKSAQNIARERIHSTANTFEQ